MLFLLPVIIFGLAAAGITALRWRGMRMGYIWLLPVVLALVTWLILLLMPVPAGAQLQEWTWLKLAEEQMTILMRVDSISWPFLFLVVSLVLIYFLTLTVRLEAEKRTILWVAWLLLGAAAVLAVVAGNLITLILLWALIDLLDFLFPRFVFKTIEPAARTGSFIPRTLAILLLILAVVFSFQSGSNPTVESINTPTGVMLFFAALLHAGILPIEKKQKVEDSACQSFEFFTHLVLIVISLNLLSRLPVVLFSPLFSQVLSTLLWLLALFFTILDFQEKTDMDYWDNAVVCLAAIATLSGHAQSMPAWCALLCVGMGMHQFYAMRSARLNIFPWLAFIAISALPFTVAATAFQGLIQANNLIWAIATLPIYALLLVDFNRKARAEKYCNEQVETWYQAVYLFGLFLLILTPFALVVKIITYQTSALQNWWLGAGVLTLTIASRLITHRSILKEKKNKRMKILITSISKFFNFKWLGKIYTWLNLIFQEVIFFFTQLLEGEGGIFWAVVILALMISLIGAGRG